MSIVISIGMPVFNGELFIKEAIDSLLCQTFRDFELIISDNASSDRTPLICQEYALKDNRIRYYRQQENIGALANFQFVLSQSRCDFFMWAACDDMWDPRWISLILNNIRAQDGMAGFGELVHIDARSKLVHHPANFASFDFQGSRIRKKINFFLSYEGNGKANLFYSIYPRKLLTDINLRTFNDDFIIIFKLLENISYLSVKDVKIYKRIHANCCGNVNEWCKKTSFFTRLYSVLLNDFLNLYKYFYYSSKSERAILAFFILVKFVKSLYNHFFEFMRLSKKFYKLNYL